MRSHVDWVTFTMSPTYRSSYGDGTSAAEVYADGLRGAFETTFSHHDIEQLFGGAWQEQGRGRAPYSDAWVMKDRGMTLYASPVLKHCCVEISGVGCEWLIEHGLMDALLAEVSERVTRIDIACDLETDVRPLEFVAETAHERMRASGHQKSESGETCYVGSQKSERYARVYRYEKPHPRAALLRIEHVFRRDYARTVCKSVVSHGLGQTAAAAGVAFGWMHSIWQPGVDSGVDISIVSSSRASGKTLFWLTDTVVPSFKRLVAEGVIKEPEEFVKRYFLTE